jgi:hypothetical protein
MQRSTRIVRIVGAATLSAFGLAMVLSGEPANAQSGEWIDTKFFRSIIEGMGFRKDGDQIDYSERAPLVLPPSAELLPSPQEQDATGTNPAWPRDPDVLRAQQAATPRKELTVNNIPASEGGLLLPSELARGRTTSPQRDAPSTNRVLSPSELGVKGGLLSGLWRKRADGEVTAFQSEPERANLTMPPPGYQTPSPTQPYGVTSKVEPPKARRFTADPIADDGK